MNTITRRSPVVTIIGHVCIDENTVGGQSYRTWGSPAMYIASFYANKYGLKSHIVSNYGSDFVPYLNDYTMMAVPPAGETTLIYQNIVENDHRTQFCPNPEVSPPVALSHELQKLIASSDILIVAPNIANFSYSYVDEAISHTKDGSQKVLLPQGLLRRNHDSLVVKGTFAKPDILSLFDVVIISDEDISSATATATTWSSSYDQTAIIVTEAARGATLCVRGASKHIPSTHPLTSSEVINPIGAGDTFSAEVAMKLYEDTPIEQAVSLAHASTAAVLTTVSTS